MAEKHDETARGGELWRIYQEAYRIHYECGDPSLNCQKAGLLAVARTAEADALERAADLAEVELDGFHPFVKELRSRARAAKKETNG